MLKRALIAVVWTCLAAPMVLARDISSPDEIELAEPLSGCYAWSSTAIQRDPLFQRVLTYAQEALKHRVTGLASYYSSFFDGRKTANGEIYRNRKYSAAHL